MSSSSQQQYGSSSQHNNQSSQHQHQIGGGVHLAHSAPDHVAAEAAHILSKQNPPMQVSSIIEHVLKVCICNT